MLAFVHYRRDKVKKIVPASFIKNFNPKTDKPQPAKKYLVFFSNRKEDSPNSMQEAGEEIPVIEDDEPSDDVGYYRATISYIGATVEEVEKAVKEGKLLREVPSRLLADKSFDSSVSKKPTSKSSSKSSSRSSSKSSSNSKPCTDRKRHRSQSPEGKECRKPADNKDKKTTPDMTSFKKNASDRNVMGLLASMSNNPVKKACRTENIKTRIKAVEAKTEKSKSKRQSSSSMLEKVSNDVIHDSHSDDPSYSPRKQRNVERELRTQLRLSESAVGKYRDLSKSLQDKLTTAEMKIATLEQREKDGNNNNPGIDGTHQQDQVLSSSAGFQDNGDFVLGAGRQASKELGNNYPGIDGAHQQDQVLSSSAGFQDNGDFVLGAGRQALKELGNNNPNIDGAHQDQVFSSSSGFQDNGDFVLGAGRLIASQEFKKLCEEHALKGGDSMFVKRVLLFAFDIAELKNSSLKGRIDPRRNDPKRQRQTNDGTDEAKPKPPLDPGRLSAIRAALCEKLRREGVDEDQLKDRTKVSKINRMIWDRIKTLKDF